MVAVVLSSSLAMAAGGGAAHAEPHVEFWKWSTHAPPVGWLWVNFMVFAALVYRFVGKPLSNHLVQRHKAVRDAIAEAGRAREEAERKAREFEERVRRLDGEIEDIKAGFRQDGEAVRDRIVEAGKQSAERLIHDAKLTIRAEQIRAQEQLKREAARLALELAEKRVAERLVDDDHRRLREDFVRELRS
jgi:F-type H+-transporting ATPase subunit b